MSKQTNNEKEAAKAAVAATAAPRASASAIDEEMRQAISRKVKARALIVPTEEEDAAITKAALSDPDNPPLTDDELARLKPARRPRGRPVQEATKVPTSIRFDNLVLDSFKALGDGWQTRINEVLMQYLVDTHQLRHRFHATVHSAENELRTLDQFMVVAVDAGQAREKVKQHLLATGREHAARGQVHTVDIGNAVVRDLPLLIG